MRKLVILCMSCIVFSCGRNATTEDMYMITDSISFIDEFPIEAQLGEATEAYTDVIGIKSFCILDTVLAFTLKGEEGVVSFYSTSGLNLGNFISIGDGPNDLLESPNFNTNADLFQQGINKYVLFHDTQKGRLLMMDVDNSITKKNLFIDEIMSGLSTSLFTIKNLGDSSYLYKELNDDGTRQIRYIFRGNKKKELNVIDKLNQANVPEGEDFNILSTLTKVHDGKVVEVPIGLNYINLYSIEDSFAITICIDKELSNINEIIKQNKAKRLYTFANVQVYDSFWGVVYIGEEERSYQLERKKKPIILFFDWQGNPLAKIKLNRQITSFDIDFKNGELYTLDVHTDEFLKYDIKKLLNDMTKNI